MLAALLILLGIGMTVYDYFIVYRTPVSELGRAEGEDGSVSHQLEVQVGDKKEKMEIDVAEKEYTSEEIQKVFEKIKKHLDQKILGKNKKP